MASNSWQSSLKEFFALRAREISEKPTIEDLCYISGRDPRLWLQENIYEDLIIDIVRQLHAGWESTVLEVGCASGFIAYGLAPRVGRYFGVDLAKPALRVARRLRLQNSFFHLSDGNKLTFVDNKFNAALCYDVFTNFPDFTIGEAIIREMLRVVRVGGYVMVGSIPDAATRTEYENHVAEVARDLEGRFGPLPQPPASRTPTLVERIRARWNRVEPKIICYYFTRQGFIDLGERLGVNVELTEIHPLNPYRGYRFNAIFHKTIGQ